MELVESMHQKKKQNCLRKLRQSINMPRIKVINPAVGIFKRRKFNDRKIKVINKNLTESVEINPSQAIMSVENCCENIAQNNTRYRRISQKIFPDMLINAQFKNMAKIENSMNSFNPKAFSTPIKFCLKQNKIKITGSCQKYNRKNIYNEFFSSIEPSINRTIKCFENSNILSLLLNRLVKVRQICNKGGDIGSLAGRSCESLVFSSEGSIWNEEVGKWIGQNEFLNLDSLPFNTPTNNLTNCSEQNDNHITHRAAEYLAFVTNTFFSPSFKNQITNVNTTNAKQLESAVMSTSYLYKSEASFTLSSPLDKATEIETMIMSSKSNETKSSWLTSSSPCLDETNFIQSYYSEGELKSRDSEFNVKNNRQWYQDLLKESIEKNTSKIEAIEQNISESPHFRYRKVDIFEKFKWD